MMAGGSSSASSSVSKASKSKMVVSSNSSVVQGAQVQSLMKVALRKYADAAPANPEALTKKWNLELNKLLKLRYYEEGVAHYEKMKAAGVTPNAATFLIMFDTYLGWEDNNAIVSLVEDIKARGLKTYFIENDTKLQAFMAEKTREGLDQAVEIHTQMLRYRKANLNPFEAPK
jgi:hypothetical protein